MEKYRQLWLVFVHIKPKNGLAFKDLVDFEGQKNNSECLGAWANVLIKAKTISEALDIAPKGLEEKGFIVEFIEKAENLAPIVEHNEASMDLTKDAEWLLASTFVLIITGPIFPYTLEKED